MSKCKNCCKEFKYQWCLDRHLRRKIPCKKIISVPSEFTQSPSEFTQSPSEFTQSPSELTQSPSELTQSPSNLHVNIV